MSRTVPIIQVDAVHPEHYPSPSPPNNYAIASNKHSQHTYNTPQPAADPWQVEHIAVPSNTNNAIAGQSGRSSAFNSTRSDNGDDGAVLPDDDFFATPRRVSESQPPHVVPKQQQQPQQSPIVATTLYNGSSSGVRVDPGERKRSICRIVLLVLLILSLLTILVLSCLTFVDTSISVLIWGLCMIPIGLFLLTCWCACWPATALEKKISACLRRNCCHLNC
jgi:hypothetical protein